MAKKQENITDEFKKLIVKSNAYLNSKNKQQTTAYLYIIFSLFALSFFGLFAIGPTITTISRLNKQLEEDKATLQQLKDKISALQSLSAQYTEIEPDLALIDNAIPKTPNISELTRQLETLSKQHNVEVQKLDVGLMEIYPIQNTASPTFSYTFSLSVKGLEADVNAFIHDVINMGRIIGIDKLTTGTEGSSDYTASLTGKVFFYNQ